MPSKEHSVDTDYTVNTRKDKLWILLGVRGPVMTIPESKAYWSGTVLRLLQEILVALLSIVRLGYLVLVDSYYGGEVICST